MILEFLPDASAELYAAAEYYELKQEGLGRRFRDEVLQVCGLIVQQPLLWRERAGGYRRVNCPVFPYYVAYFIRGDLIVARRSLTAISPRLLETQIIQAMTPNYPVAANLATTLCCHAASERREVAGRNRSA